MSLDLRVDPIDQFWCFEVEAKTKREREKEKENEKDYVKGASHSFDVHYPRDSLFLPHCRSRFPIAPSRFSLTRWSR
jgi:hypothetical protein